MNTFSNRFEQPSLLRQFVLLSSEEWQFLHTNILQGSVELETDACIMIISLLLIHW